MFTYLQQDMVTCVKAVEGASEHHCRVLVRFDFSHGRHPPKNNWQFRPHSLSDALLYTLPSRGICGQSFLSEITVLKIHKTDAQLALLNPKTQMLSLQPGTSELRVRSNDDVCMYDVFLPRIQASSGGGNTRPKHKNPSPTSEVKPDGCSLSYIYGVFIISLVIPRLKVDYFIKKDQNIKF